jgi:hypothetical protein
VSRRRKRGDGEGAPSQPPPPPPAALTALERRIVAIERDDHTRECRLTHDGLAYAEQLARDGHSNGGIARALGIDRDTLTAIRRRRPEVDERLAAGRAVLEAELVHHLLTAARGGEWVAALALGKVRFGWREGHDRDGSTTVAVQIIVPGSQSMDDFLAQAGPVRELEGERPSDG